MIRKLIALACLTLPLVTLAATTSTTASSQTSDANKQADEKANEAAKKAKEEASKQAKKTELKRVQSRGTVMGACLKQAADKKLYGVDKRVFLGKCAKAK
jgi:hypothetical protein